LNKKIAIAISIVTVLGIIGLSIDNLFIHNSTKNLPIIMNETRIPNVSTRHYIEVNLNESMHFSAR